MTTETTTTKDPITTAIANADTLQGGTSADAIVTAAAAAPAFDEDAELLRLQKEQEAIDQANVKALEKGTTGTDAGKTNDGQDTAAGATGADKGQHQPPAADPKDRAIIALRKQNQALTLKLSETIGETRVLKQLVEAGVAQPAKTDTTDTQVDPNSPQGKIAAIDAEILALAEKVESGAIAMPEYERARLPLMDQRFQLQAQSLMPSNQRAQPDATITDTAVQDHLNKLLQDHPYVATMTHEQLEPYQAKALQALQLEGKLGLGENRDNMALRERMAELVRADTLASLGITEDPRKKGNGSPADAPAGNLSPTAQQREAKLQLAGTHPPDISKTGTAVTGTGTTPQAAMATLNGFGGDEEAAIKWLSAHPEVAQLVST